MDDDSIATDDDRQTPSNGQSSSDDISSVTTENLSITVHENNQQRMSSMSSIRVDPVKIINHSSLTNLNIKHPYQSNDNDEKRIISDVHVKISRINRASLHSLTIEPSLSRLDACSRRKSTGNAIVSRSNKRISQIANDDRTNQETIHVTSRQNTIRANQTPTIANIKQDSDQKVNTSKPMVTRVSFSNELPFRMDQKELHVTVKHVSVNSKKSS
jgi:hypothetical protein